MSQKVQQYQKKVYQPQWAVNMTVVFKSWSMKCRMKMPTSFKIDFIHPWFAVVLINWTAKKCREPIYYLVSKGSFYEKLFNNMTQLHVSRFLWISSDTDETDEQKKIRKVSWVLLRNNNTHNAWKVFQLNWMPCF